MAFILVPIESSLGLLEASILSGSLIFGGRLAVLKLIERSGFGAMVDNSEFANGHRFHFQFSHFSVTFGRGAQKITSILA